MDHNFYEWSEKAENATEKGKVLKFDRYGKNLRYNSDGIYSYGTKIAHIDLNLRTIQKLGHWSPTTSKHFNHAAKLLDTRYDFRPIEAAPSGGTLESLGPNVHVQHLSYDDHT